MIVPKKHGIKEEEKTIELLNKSFAMDEPPVDRIAARGASLAAAQVRLARPGKRRLVWRLGVGLTALTALAAASVVSRPAPPSNLTMITRALAAIEKTDMVIYYKTTEELSGGPVLPAGPLRDWKRVSVEENWLDRANKMYKTVGSDGRDYFASLTRDGKSIGFEGVKGERVDVSETNADQFYDPLLDQVAYYRQMLKEKQAKIVGEETLDGVDVYKLEMTVLSPETYRVDKRRNMEVDTMYLRKDTFLPVRVVSRGYLVDDAGRKEPTDTRVRSYEEIKLIPADQLDKSVFTLDIPPGATVRQDYSYNLKQAADFKDFDLFYLGKEFAGFEFSSGVSVHGGEDAVPAGMPGIQAVIDYHNEKYDDGISLLMWPRFDLDVLIKASYSVPQNKITDVEIEGQPAVLILTPLSDGPYYHLLFNKGRSSVEIGARGKETIIEAASSLQRIN